MKPLAKSGNFFHSVNLLKINIYLYIEQLLCIGNCDEQIKAAVTQRYINNNI